MVVLKMLYNSQNIAREFLEEVKSHVTMNNAGGYVIQCYGMSKDSKTNNFIVVMEYKKNGSLRHYLDKNYYSIPWIEKLYILNNIAKGLSNIHEKGFVHRDFHSGNILKGDGFDALITDLGLSRPADQDQKDNTIHGVLPYVAPEVLMKNKYTEKSDIYSLGMICYEVIAGIPPFHDVPHQAHLAFDIIKGLRPKFKIKVPKLLLDLINQCWDKDPMKRPNARKIHEMIYEWWLDLDVQCYVMMKAYSMNFEINDDIDFENDEDGDE
ncbi:1656_t:CDS:2 [Funneliformis geosporum]|nr:1656_t:CDS:2 [Funneliformis geosporum]